MNLLIPPIPTSFSLFFFLSKLQLTDKYVQNILFLMLGFKPRTSGVRSNRSASWATNQLFLFISLSVLLLAIPLSNIFIPLSCSVLFFSLSLSVIVLFHLLTLALLESSVLLNFLTPPPLLNILLSLFLFLSRGLYYITLRRKIMEKFADQFSP